MTNPVSWDKGTSPELSSSLLPHLGWGRIWPSGAWCCSPGLLQSGGRLELEHPNPQAQPKRWPRGWHPVRAAGTMQTHMTLGPVWPWGSTGLKADTPDWPSHPSRHCGGCPAGRPTEDTQQSPLQVLPLGHLEKWQQSVQADSYPKPHRNMGQTPMGHGAAGGAVRRESRERATGSAGSLPPKIEE